MGNGAESALQSCIMPCSLALALVSLFVSILTDCRKTEDVLRPRQQIRPNFINVHNIFLAILN